MNFSHSSTYSGLNNSNMVNADKADIVDLHISGSLTGNLDNITPHLTIGNVQSVPYGTPSSATLTGSSNNPILNLSLERGARGATEDLGDRNEIDGVDIFGIIGGVLGVVATVSILTAIQSQITALAGAIEGLAIRIYNLEIKTALMSIVGDSSRFAGDVHVTSGLMSNINLNSDGSALFAKKITSETDIEAQGIMKTNNISSIGDTLNIGNQNLGLNPFENTNTINIGNAFSKVVISGDVTFLDSNFRVTTDGFINQMINLMPLPQF